MRAARIKNSEGERRGRSGLKEASMVFLGTGRADPSPQVCDQIAIAAKRKYTTLSCEHIEPNQKKICKGLAEGEVKSNQKAAEQFQDEEFFNSEELADKLQKEEVWNLVKVKSNQKAAEQFQDKEFFNAPKTLQDKWAEELADKLQEEEYSKGPENEAAKGVIQASTKLLFKKWSVNHQEDPQKSGFGGPLVPQSDPDEEFVGNPRKNVAQNHIRTSRVESIPSLAERIDDQETNFAEYPRIATAVTLGLLPCDSVCELCSRIEAHVDKIREECASDTSFRRGRLITMYEAAVRHGIVQGYYERLQDINSPVLDAFMREKENIPKFYGNKKIKEFPIISEKEWLENRDLLNSKLTMLGMSGPQDWNEMRPCHYILWKLWWDHPGWLESLYDADTQESNALRGYDQENSSAEDSSNSYSFAPKAFAETHSAKTSISAC